MYLQSRPKAFLVESKTSPFVSDVQATSVGQETNRICKIILKIFHPSIQIIDHFPQQTARRSGLTMFEQNFDV